MVEVRMDDGAPITLRRHGNPQGTRLVLSHANGLSADAYYPFWSLLADRFDLILYDFRNHGWNPVGNPVGDLGAHDIATFVRDNERVVQAIDRRFGDTPKIGVFHSLSAQTAVLQVAASGGFSALVLFDPFICPPGCAPQHLETLAILGHEICVAHGGGDFARDGSQMCLLSVAGCRTRSGKISPHPRGAHTCGHGDAPIQAGRQRDGSRLTTYALSKIKVRVRDGRE